MSIRSLRSEWGPMLRLAAPVVVAELGWTAMGTVDTLMVGRLSAEAIGAVALGTAVFLGITIFGMGLLLGLDTMISQAHGAGRLDECRRSFLHGVYAACLLTFPLTAVLLGVVGLLPDFGIHPDVLALTIPYLRPVVYSLLPLLLYSASRRFLQATGHETAVMVILIAANAINALTNWALIFGNLGLPRLGVVGAGWATFVSRAFMALAMIGCVLFHQGKELRGTSFAPEWSRFRRLFDLGIPAAFQITLELGLFAVATGLAGRLDPASLAAHQVAITVASTTFMVPLGVSSAAAVRVGRASGRHDPAAIARSGWTAILLGVSFMATAMLTLLLLPRQIIGLFTADGDVLSVG
ncbi:MAG TPA: MATE family efflux transporter, partial [Vicinamibacteria bacterium]|nr:MATE family efflux transporter [Vicinamibacteria bacterium]